MTVQSNNLNASTQIVPYETDMGTGPRARIGTIVLATDHTIEEEWRAMLRLDGVAFYVARIWNDAQVTPETLKALGDDIGGATRLILPNDERLDAVAFACTSGAMILGEDAVAAKVNAVRNGVPVTSPMMAGLTGLRMLGAKRIALLTPYIDSINQMMRAYIEKQGFEVVAVSSFNTPDDLIATSITPEAVLEAAIKIGQDPAVEAIFISCTSLRAASIIEQLEAVTGKPALSSNHALAWHALRLAGYDDPVSGWGQLFRLPLSGDLASTAPMAAN